MLMELVFILDGFSANKTGLVVIISLKGRNNLYDYVVIFSSYAATTNKIVRMCCP